MVSRVQRTKLVSNKVELKESDNRFTPPFFIQAVEHSFGRIAFDPCWHPASAVRPLAYLDVRRGDDGLRDAWRGRLVFVNPPWSKQKLWVERAHHQWSKGNVKTVVCLVPAKTDTKLFHRVLSQDADVYFIEGRPHFFKEDGTSEATMVSAMVVMFGATAEQKKRFAERVPGSWWRPQRRAPVFRAETPAGMPSFIKVFPVTSCAAQLSGSSRATALCGPLAGRG
jgi:hypothetical protein